jgi:branched-subunit amino acid aminotransferase/4-amino-4-deoxychorismate lyase
MIDRRPTVRSSEAALPWSDPAVQWGLGVFETIAVRDGDPRFLDEHLARLDSSATHLSIPLPDRKDIEKAVKALARKIEGGHGWLKLLVSRSGEWTAFGGPSDPKDENRAVSAVLLSGRRHRLDPLAGMKTLATSAGGGPSPRPAAWAPTKGSGSTTAATSWRRAPATSSS